MAAFLFDSESGLPIVVLRPDNAKEKMLRLARLHRKGNATKKDFDDLLRSQGHTFVGYLSAPPGNKVLNADGTEFGDLKSGDSFVSGPQFARPSVSKGNPTV